MPLFFFSVCMNLNFSQEKLLVSLLIVLLCFVRVARARIFLVLCSIFHIGASVGGFYCN